MMKHEKAIFIFRRDLRISDNTGLHEALITSKKVYCFFIIDPCQVSDQNSYRSNRALHFMNEALHSLASLFKEHGAQLHILYGDTEKMVKHIISNIKPNALFLNYDYTPYSRTRDEKIIELCNKHHVLFSGYHDLLLIGNPALILNNTGTPYRLYTPFYKKAITIPVRSPLPMRYNNIAMLSPHVLPLIPLSKLSHYLGVSAPLKTPNNVMGTHQQAAYMLNILYKQSSYAKTRDFPIDPTTHLSSYLKFGLLSIRHVYHSIISILGDQHPLIRQLYWRDFFTYVCYHAPLVLGNAYNKTYSHIPWVSNESTFLQWTQGKTGFPLVDAGMRELNTTGFMHNRVRMLVAFFLTKDLHINWQWGERYFAQHLIDYDPAVNNGNWQWVASTGCDALPYIRIFNPWAQQKKFDPQALYIKKWVPELQSIPAAAIHAWYKPEIRKQYTTKYQAPMVDHAYERKHTLIMYTSHKKK